MGDRRDAEFSDYVMARRARLLQTAYLFTGSWQLAEDVVQTALIKLCVAWPRVRRDHSVDAFVRRIIVNCSADERRRPWRRERQSLEGVDVGHGPAPSFEDSTVLLAALDQLPDRQRRTVVLRYFAGLTVEETAADLGCSTGTVKSQTSHALRKLEVLLSPTFNDAKG